jgi:tetratricopeptide (TPR) repeat protein
VNAIVSGLRYTLPFLCLLVACGGEKPPAQTPKLPPADPQAVSKMAQAIEAAKDKEGVDRAIELLQQAVRSDAKLWEAHYDLGVLLAEKGELDEAEKHLTEAALLAPNAEDVLVALSEVRRRQGNASGAIDALQAFVAKHPDAVVARVALMSALREGGRTDEAIQHAQEVLVRRSGDPSALSELALAYLEKGEIDTAELLSKESLKAKEQSAVAERTAGLVALKQGDDAIAFRHFQRASELDPNDTTARLNMGTVLLEAGVYQRAEQEFRAVLEKKPLDLDAGIGLAAALRGQGTRDNPAPFREAEKVLLELLKQQSRAPAVAFNLGVLYADFMQKPADAKQMFERFLDFAPRQHPSRELATKKLAELAGGAR